MARKRTCDTPRLVVHGTVGQITGGGFPDVGGGNSSLG